MYTFINLLQISYSSIKVSNLIWLLIVAANYGHYNCLSYIINYFETKCTSVNMMKQTFSDSWLGLFDNKNVLTYDPRGRF